MTNKQQAILLSIHPDPINNIPYAKLKCPSCYGIVSHSTPYDTEEHGDRVANCSYEGRLKYCPEYTLPSRLINHILTNYKHKLDNNKSISISQIKETKTINK